MEDLLYFLNENDDVKSFLSDDELKDLNDISDVLKQIKDQSKTEDIDKTFETVNEKIQKFLKNISENHKDNEDLKKIIENEELDPIKKIYEIKKMKIKTEKTPEEPKSDVISQNIETKNNETKNELAELISHFKDGKINTFVGELKGHIKDTDADIEKWMKSEDELEKYDSKIKELGNNLASQIIPRIWINNYILKTNESFEISLDHILLENMDELKTKIESLFKDKLKTVMLSKETNEFKTNYDKWVKEVNEIITQINNEELTAKINQITDPLEKLVQCVEFIRLSKDEIEESYTSLKNFQSFIKSKI